MSNTYFLSNRKEKHWSQLTRQIQMFCLRKGIPLNVEIKIGISDPLFYQTKFNTIKITIK
jgi:hypothetical protein